MKNTSARSSYPVALVLVVGLAALFFLLDSVPAPPTTDAPAERAIRPERGSRPEPPSLVGHADPSARRRSSLTLAGLDRLVAYRFTAWDVARKVVDEGEVAVPFLVGALRSKDHRYSALRALQLVPEEATPALLALLDDGSEETRGAALAVLESTASWWISEGQAPAIIERIAADLVRAGEKEQALRLRVIEAAGVHAETPRDALLQVLATAEGDTLKKAAATAAYLARPDPDLANVLTRRWLDMAHTRAREAADVSTDEGKVVGEDVVIELDSDEELIPTALAGLGPPPPETVALLARSLSTLASRDQELALWILRDWGAAAEPLLPVLEAHAFEGRTRRAAVRALVRIPGGELSAAIMAIEGATAPITDLRALLDLARLGDRFERAWPYLLSVAEQDTGPRRAAAMRALGYAPVELFMHALPLLRTALADDDAAVRSAAAHAAFGREERYAGDRELVATGLMHDDASIRLSAVRWFGRRREGSRDEADAALVAPRLADANTEVRFEAGNVIQNIGVAPMSALPLARANLLHDDRLVRIGAGRVLSTLGVLAADAVPEMIAAVEDASRDNFGLYALAETRVMNADVREALRTYVRERKNWPGSVLRCFEERAAFLELEFRARLETECRCCDLYLLARYTEDPEDFAAWLTRRRVLFRDKDAISAYRELGALGVPHLVREGLSTKQGLGPRTARTAITTMGTDAAPALLALTNDEQPEVRKLALEILVDAAPTEALGTFAELLAEGDPALRAIGARGIRAAAAEGADVAGYAELLIEHLGDAEAEVRQRCWQVLVKGDDLAPSLLPQAEAALADPAPNVRVAAAEAAIALGADVEPALAELRAVLDVPLRYWGGISVGGGRGGRTEKSFSDAEKVWAEAARVLARLGPRGSPLAKTIPWAALRHGDPCMQQILLESLLAMGEDAAPALDLLDEVSRTYTAEIMWEDTVDPLEEILDAIYARFDRKRPRHAPNPFWW